MGCRVLTSLCPIFSSPQKKKVESTSNAARNPVAVVKRQLNLDSVRYMQCIYYLQNYGTPNDLLAFWLRHQLLEDACRYVLGHCHQLAATEQSASINNNNATNAGNQLFIDLVLYILAHNKLKEFKEILLKIDPQLGKWRECLLATCRYFNARKESVLLLEFQVLMRDFIRAGLTCIKLFERNEDLTEKINYLNLAKQHLQQGLEEYQAEVNKQGGTVSINSNILGNKSISDIHRYVKTINLQLEATKFMQQLLAKSKGAKTNNNNNNISINVLEPEQSEQNEEDGQGKKKKQKNSLFGTTQAKSIIAERMLVEHNFDLGFKIVQEFHLPMARIYNNALLKLAQSKQTKFVNELLKSIKPFLNDDEWDPILSAIVQVYAEQNQDPNTAEKFATSIKSEESKAQALLVCGKLKSAYLSAIKTGNVDIVKDIRDEAKKRGAKRELELCEKFIASKTNQSAVVSNNNNK
jgi:zinc finger FYVE domain-containing protein 26